MWSLATLAAIGGMLLALVVVVGTLSMASPILTGQGKRDATMLAFVCVPVLQVALVSVATVREDARPGMAMKLYALTIVLLAALLAIPAFW
jgi:hypothetical protein